MADIKDSEDLCRYVNTSAELKLMGCTHHNASSTSTTTTSTSSSSSSSSPSSSSSGSSLLVVGNRLPTLTNYSMTNVFGNSPPNPVVEQHHQNSFYHYVITATPLTPNQVVPGHHHVYGQQQQQHHIAEHFPESEQVPFSEYIPDYYDTFYNFTDDIEWEVVHQLNMYYVPLLIVVGFVGNILSCVVFLNTRLRMRSSSYYLAALAVADVTYLFVLFLVWLELLGFNTFNVNVGCQLIIYLGSVSSSLSVWLTVAFTIERFIAVQYPLQRPTMCTVRRAKTIIVVLFSFSAFIHVYVFVTAGMEYEEGEVFPVCDLRKGYKELMNIINWLDTLMTLVIPFIMIVIMNTLIARQLIKFSRRHRQRDVLRLHGEGELGLPNVIHKVGNSLRLLFLAVFLY
ncbi:FMRFamide receptor-like [Oratosquilla oratoria]|uniref:FMRFamide receptor-like n=1 Tax=Oratosquilla oratoria TaxID=337810 RepID=UPI003F76EEC9